MTEPFDFHTLGDIATTFYGGLHFLIGDPLGSILTIEAFLGLALGGLIVLTAGDVRRLITYVVVPMCVIVIIMSVALITQIPNADTRAVAVLSMGAGLIYAYAIRPWTWL